MDVGEELTPKRRGLCTLAAKVNFSEVSHFPFFLLDSWVPGAHARQSKATHALLLDGRCCIPHLICLHTALPFLKNLPLYISSHTVKTLGWWKQLCHSGGGGISFLKKYFLTNKRSIHCGFQRWRFRNRALGAVCVLTQGTHGNWFHSSSWRHVAVWIRIPGGLRRCWKAEALWVKDTMFVILR